MQRALLCLFLLPVFLGAAFTQNATDRVIAEAQKPSALEANLQKLTGQIGRRVPGTPAMQKAVQWGVEAFHETHLDDQLKTFGMWRDWEMRKRGRKD